ncbi:metallophosphoesterase [Ottowia sp. GY511]|uniref:Metallophosphoesterase family protein n=1 Tax=Ottowia flava TaxID=2675430 RepID=A0ABW4KVT0_9BURK|nr:metallophosphoesterase family protein [Ottowia sp. GY511]TXK30888.1 metallophosphoesterase [Ottowia sp. GY511]
MKIALLSDIHANLHALDACLAHAEAAGVQGYALLGDLVGYGAFPAEVVRRAMALVAAGAPAVMGNHDHYANVQVTDAKQMAHTGVAWTQAQLGGPELGFLAQLPMTARLGSALLVHASADAPPQWRYVTNPQLAALSLDGATEPPTGSDAVHYVFGGHVHAQTLYFRGGAGKLMPFAPTPGVPIPVPRHRRWLATVGSVGQPRDGRVDAMYAIFDEAAAQLTFHRVPYDVQAAAAAIRATPLPPFFADRLETGQ